MQPDQNQATDQSQVAQKQLSEANPLVAMQPGEQIICEVKRHPIGLIGTYITAGLILVVAFAAAIAVPSLLQNTTMPHSQLVTASTLGFVIVALFVLLFTIIERTVYKGNRWIVTSDSITQISQVGLFSRHSSQLSLHNLEDISVIQNGLIQSSLNYGTLKAETAGERSKFQFPFCPNPNKCAQEILMAREKFMEGGGYEGKSDQTGVDVNTEA